MAQVDVRVRVECADALVRKSQLLVLKYAQASYGVDRAAVTGLQVDPRRLPGVGEHLLVEGGSDAGPTQVLFVGVQPLSVFDYREVRAFAERAIRIAGRHAPAITQLCLTLHGANTGLDEIEAFNSELAGIRESLLAGEGPANLGEIVFLERDARRARRLADALVRALPDGSIGLPSADQTEAGVRADDKLVSAGYDSSNLGHAFVAMPFSDAFDDAFHFGIAPSIRRANLLCERMDRETFVGDIVTHMRDRIKRAKVVVADLTGANPNVYLEVGYAWGLQVPTVLLCHTNGSLEFDVKGHRCLMYSSIRDLESKLEQEISRLIPTITG